MYDDPYDFSGYPAKALTNGSCRRALWLAEGLFAGLPDDEDDAFWLQSELDDLSDADKQTLQRIYFMNGQCHALALALHELTGWQIMGLGFHKYERCPDHIFVVTDCGNGLDALGTFQPGQHQISTNCQTDWRPVSADEIAMFCVRPEHGDYYSPPNMKAAREFAQQIACAAVV